MSSTFDDTTAERNYFMAHAYPYLSAFCKTRGLSFGTVDLRCATLLQYALVRTEQNR